MTRSFTIEAVYRNKKKLKYEGGRYISNTPSSAAKKVFSNVYNDIESNGKMSLEIHIRETTINSLKKIYKYKVTRVKDTTEVEVNGKIIKYNFTTKVTSI